MNKKAPGFKSGTQLWCVPGLLLVILLAAACGPSTPTPVSISTGVAAAPTKTPTPVSPPSHTPEPLDTPTPVPTSTPPPPTPTEALLPDEMDLKATIVAGLPPTPTPAAGDEADWGDVALLPLDTDASGPPLWAAYSVGMGFYDLEHGPFVAVYTYEQGDWLELGRVVLTDCATYINEGALVQVEVEPSHTWLELESYTGAHSGCYDLFRFDGETLRREVGHFNSSPGVGATEDLDGDGLQEVLLNYTENYVFCYACGVRLPLFEILRWDGEQLVAVELVTLPKEAPDSVWQLNNQAVELAQAGLWKDAQAAIAEAATLKVLNTEFAPMVAWNKILIDMHADALADQISNEIYPLLANVFYGDYDAAVDVMRSYSMAEIWEPDSPLIVGTAAEGWELVLSDWLSWTTDLALPVQPDLAPAHFLQGWGAHLRDPDDPAVLTAVARAVELAPGDALFSDSLAYLGPSEPAETPEAPAAFQPLDPDACYELGQVMMSTIDMTVTLETAHFADYLSGISGTGCQLAATGTGADFESHTVIYDDLQAMLVERGWQEDVMYAAGGPTGMGAGFRQDGALCLLMAGWEPAEDADCPSDRPISECDLEPEQQLYTITLNCAQGTSVPTPEVELPPPPVGEGQWQVRTLLVGPGEPGRLYALLTDESSWAWPAEFAHLLVSDDYGQTWSKFAGGRPPGECIRNVNLDYAAPPTDDALYASTCEGLYRWTGGEWTLVSPREPGMVAVVYGQPDVIWATDVFAGGVPVVRSDDGGTTWVPAADGLVHFNGVANLGLDPRDANTLYAVIWPKYAGTYLRRGSANGRWDFMPTPMNNVQIDSGITIDGATGTLYVTAYVSSTWQLWYSLNPNTPDLNDVRWELAHDFGPDVSWASLLASGWSPEGLALYANLSFFVDKKTSAEVSPPVLHRSLDGGQTWELLPIP